MAKVTVERTIRCNPQEVLAFVLDVRRYSEVDAKIGPIDWVRSDGEVTDFRFRPRLPGIPGSALKSVSRMRLSPGERVDVTYPPLPQNRLVRRVSTFTASFVCEPVAGGTRLRRTISIELVPALRWLVEPVLRRTLPGDVEREVSGAKDHLERQTDKQGGR